LLVPPVAPSVIQLLLKQGHLYFVLSAGVRKVVPDREAQEAEGANANEGIDQPYKRADPQSG